VRNPGKVSDRTKFDLRAVLELHRELNPVAGRPILVAIDSSTGQLFFTSAKGLCVGRDRRARESGDGRLGA
jgi:hypothetical protein